MALPIDILIIGAGQAGLALAYHLRSTSFRFQLVDGGARLGDSWRARYDSLTLFTPRRFSALPGLGLAGDPEGYAGRDEFADYLEAYAHRFSLPVTTGTRLRALERVDGRFRAASSAGAIEARAVVLATGAFQTPAVPALAAGLGPRVRQFTPANYRNPAQVPAGATVVVAGDGATGRDLARELAPGRAVYLACGRRRPSLPEHFLGRSLFWWLAKTGALTASPRTPIGRYLQASDGFPTRGTDLGSLRRHSVRLRPRGAGAAGAQLPFA
ncbi:MAG: NAD(P)-binding domain-containing protein, partial [Anaerolineales bacterium]|nr:NAD(P)-binding domain-containing protein [Anaerolineales bacterium]